MPSKELGELIRRSKGVRMTKEELELQRRSFAYGNTKIENDRVTRDSINQQAELLAKRNGSKEQG